MFRKNRRNDDKTKEAIVNIRRVAKVVKGGRRFGFSVLIAVGLEDGRIGIGLGKANEVPEAIRKAKENAKKEAFAVSSYKGTIPHEVEARYKGAIVLLKPASEGTGIIAGGPVRRILELSPIHDILSKSLGSSNHVNVAKATIKALQQLRTLQQIATIRGKLPKEIYTVDEE